MSAIFGEVLRFPQEKGPEVRLVTFGNQFYSRRETEDGYSVIYDKGLGLYCYALLVDGAYVSSGVPLSQNPPPDLEKHLLESSDVRRTKAEESISRSNSS
jgi:hypothetical protein